VIKRFDATYSKTPEGFSPPKSSVQVKNATDQKVTMPSASQTPELFSQNPTDLLTTRCGLQIGKPFGYSAKC
jgi:hypothetical protein